MPLEPTEILRTIVVTVWILARQGWTNKVDLAPVDPATLPGEATAFIVITRAPMRGDLLQPGHLLLALRQAVFQMVGPPQSFCGLRATLKLRGRPLAIMAITTERPPRRPRINPSTHDPIIIERDKSNKTLALQGNLLAADSGVFDDPYFSNCQIAWAYSPNGHSIPQEDVWTSWVDTLANIAYHNSRDPFDHVTGYSAPGPGRTKLEVKGTSIERQLNWAHVLGFLGTVGSRVIVKENRFAEMSFRILYRGDEIGIGVLSRDWAVDIADGG
ncbi:MAG: hypothetical protein Q9186_003176 [Xanthomendoza sp. 1 TL-2023]